jgi:hypothetical protein
MSLVNKKSLYDRHVRTVLGNNVGVDVPSAGNYYTSEGASDSPFNSSDHMVDLMTQDVLSNNSQITYLHSPNESTYQDLDGLANNPNFADATGAGKQLNGVDLHEAMLMNSYTYSHGGFPSLVGPSPGPTGHSPFQDFIVNSINDFPSAEPLLGQFGGPYNNMGPSDGFY